MEEIPAGGGRLAFEGEFPQTSAETLFAYWTDPGLLCRWWPQHAEIEPMQGGRYHLSWPAMGWLLRGELVGYDPGASLAFTWVWDHEHDIAPGRVRVMLRPLGEGGTRLRVEHESFGDTPDDRARLQQIREGWLHFLARLRMAVQHDHGERSGGQDRNTAPGYAPGGGTK